jgi:hypothetical protein
MAKYRAPKRGKEKAAPKADAKTSILRALPCLILVLIGVALFSMLLATMMRSSG